MLETGRHGASPEWIAAAESAVAHAERQLIIAGADPADERVRGDRSASPDDAARANGQETPSAEV
jgi:hypothetical protein